MKELSNYEKLEKFRTNQETDYSKPSDAKKSLISKQKGMTLQSTKNNPQGQAQGEQRDLARLIDYYRVRVDLIEKERMDNLNKIENLKIPNEAKHKTEWEFKRRQDELLELEQAIYEANTKLNNERKRSIQYSNVIETFKNRKNEDHRRITQLLQLAEPIEQTVKLYEGRPPEKTEKYSNFNFENSNENNEYMPKDSVSIKKHMAKKSKSTNKFKNNKGKTTGGNKQPLFRIPPTDEKQQILRTVFFQNEEKATVLNTENSTLKKEIEEIKNTYDNKIIKIEQNRRIREEEFRQECLIYERETEDLIKKNEKLENLNYEITKDIMTLKYDNGKTEREKYEELEKIKIKNNNLENELKQIVSKTNKERLYAITEYNRKTREITKCLTGQAKVQEESANIIKEQYNQIQKIYNNKVKELTDKFNNLNSKCSSLENKKNYTIDGYINEIDLMMKRIVSYQGYIKKMNYYVNKQINKIEEEKRQNINPNYNLAEQNYMQDINNNNNNINFNSNIHNANASSNEFYDGSNENENENMKNTDISSRQRDYEPEFNQDASENY